MKESGRDSYYNYAELAEQCPTLGRNNHLFEREMKPSLGQTNSQFVIQEKDGKIFHTKSVRVLIGYYIVPYNLDSLKRVVN